MRFAGRTSRQYHLPALAVPRRAALVGLALLSWVAAPALAGAGEETLPVICAIEIEIEGEARTDTAVVLRELGLAVGDPFDEKDLDRFWDNLEDCGLFKFVEMDFEEEEPGFVTLFVTVEEEKFPRVLPLIDFDRRHDYLVGIRVANPNLRGKGESLELTSYFYRLQR